MGFLDAMKGANLNFGTVDSPDFADCYITIKGDRFMITGAQAGTFEFAKSDVAEFKVVASGGDWVKYKMTFKNGRCAVIHSVVASAAAGQKALKVAPIERFFGDLL